MPLTGTKTSVVLTPGLSAHATLQVAEAANYGPGCGITQAAGLRVYPPGQTSSLYISHSGQGCSNSNDVVLHVGVMQ